MLEGLRHCSGVPSRDQEQLKDAAAVSRLAAARNPLLKALGLSSGLRGAEKPRGQAEGEQGLWQGLSGGGTWDILAMKCLSKNPL